MPPKHDAGTATRHYRAFWQRRCRSAAAGAVLKPQGGNCAVLPYVFYGRYQYLLHIAAFTFYPKICTEFFLYPQSRGLALFCSASACLYIVRPPAKPGACGSPKVYLKTKKMTDILQTQAGFCVCRISKAAFSCFACAGKRCAAVSRKSRERYVSFLFIVCYPFFLYPQSQQGPPVARVYCRTKFVTPPASLMV